VETPETRYAKSGDVSIAYQVVGDGPGDLVFVSGFATHVELAWEFPPLARFLNRLASFSRLIVFDKRGTGLSDPVPDVPSLETRMDDLRAVMDATGSDRATLFGHSEGAPLCILFAATYPERTTSLILSGAMARSTSDDDYPLALSADDYRAAANEFLAPVWGQGLLDEVFAPSFADDPAAQRWASRHERYSATPAMVIQLSEMFLDVDVRDVLPSVHTPTLALHRRHDRVVSPLAGRWLADHIGGARFVEFEGNDHLPWAGDQDALLDEVQEFVTGTRPMAEPDRVLATVLFTDIVGSTERAAALGDRGWKEMLAEHDDIIRRELDRFRGTLVKTTGDGLLATFDGPARAVRCAAAIRDALGAHGLRIRAGAHTGEIELMGDDVSGIAVHIGARISALAGPGEVLVSGTVKDLSCGSGIEFEDRGTHTLKGIPDEWRVFGVSAT
jgi:pimeloyl-ACP methyl ester carboxylesterase